MFQPSKLGTKAHWDSVYKEEIANFQDYGDEGEIWYRFVCSGIIFGPKNLRFGAETIEKVVEWALEHVSPTSDPSILEIGSGNGSLLFSLVESGYNPERLSGIDYSLDAVKLAQMVASNRGAAADIAFTTCDFLDDDPPLLPYMDRLNSWNVVLDKGTYDAIALGEKDEQGRSPANTYPARIARLLRPEGIFLITSCNFTEDELRASFTDPKTGLLYHSRIQHPTYTYGGRTGSSVSSIAFRKSDADVRNW